MPMCQTTDYWYNKWSNNCYSRACIIRVTNGCNEKCPHCCFRSGPDNYRRMSIETARKVNTWIPKKIAINIMGGELTVLDNYPEIILSLAESRNEVRIQTNGQWAKTKAGLYKFIKAVNQASSICARLDVAIADDRWHNQLGTIAKKRFKQCRTNVTLIKNHDIHLTPVGRAWDNNLIISPNSHASCEIMSNMMVTEDGMISRCPYGYMPWKHFSETTWDDAQDYVWGWRSEKLSEGMNCHACMEIVEASKCK